MNKSNIVLELPGFSGFKLLYEAISSEGCHMNGILGKGLEYLIVEPILDAGYNCTLMSRLGSEVINDADISYFDIPGVDNKVVLTETSLVVFSTYNGNLDIKKQDLLGLFFGLNPLCYLALLFIFLVFSFIWSYLEMKTKEMKHEVASKFPQARKSGFWLMLCALLDQDQYPDIALVSFKIIGFCFTFFFWVVIDQYLMDIIGTDMVVFKEPPVVRSYEDFIEQGRRQPAIAWCQETKFFENAKKGSLEEMIGKRGIYVSGTLKDVRIFSILEGLRNGSIAGWVRKPGANILASFFKANIIDAGFENYRGLVYADKSDKIVTYSLKYKSGLRYLDKFLSRFRRTSEAGIIRYLLEDCFSTAAGEFPIADQNLFSSQVMHDDMPLPVIALSSLRRFIITLIILVVLSCFVLVWEIRTSKKNKIIPRKPKSSYV